jgi:transposase
MPAKLDRRLKLDALTFNQQGMTQVQAADQMGISRRSIQRAKAKLENYGDVEGGTKKRGRKRLLSPEMEDV